MKVLVGCEFSGIVRDAFTARGHDAISCDLLPTERPGKHYQCDVMDILDKGWDLIIAHPPCTYLSVASACRLYPQKGVLNEARYKQGLEAKDFFMSFYNANCDKIAVENPVPLTIFELPQHTQQVQPYEFGHPYSKKTRLWLKGLPKLIPTEVITEGIVSWVNAGSKDHKGNPRKQIGKKSSASNRSRTFQGIADAMADQWGSPQNKELTLDLQETNKNRQQTL